MDLTKHNKLYQRMVRSVAQEAPQDIPKLHLTMEAYTGDPRILDHFLTTFGSDNPWEAAQNAHLRQAIFRTAGEIKETGSIHGVSVSGHKLTDQIFVLTHKYDPTRVWRSGSQAITKIMQDFGDYTQKRSFRVDGQSKIKEGKERQRRKNLDNIVETLEEVLNNPDRVSDVQSNNDRYKVHSILGLDDELKTRLMQLDRVIHGGASYDSGHLTNLLAADKGGMLFGWFERQKESLPQTIRDIYTTVSSSVIDLPDQDHKSMYGALLAYAAVNMPIKRESAVGGYQKDLDFILALPQDHKIIQKHGQVDLTSIRSLLEQTEITLIDATRIFDAYPVDEVRQEVNAAYKAQFKAEIESVFDTLKPLFIQDQKWRDDSYGKSVPMTRLRKTIFSAALQQKDFAAVRDYLRTQTIAADDQRHLKSTPMNEWKETIDGVVKAGYKLQFLQNYLQSHNLGVVNQEDAGSLAKSLHKKMPRGKRYEAAERFEEVFEISLADFIERVVDRNPVFYRQNPDLQRLGAANLFDTKFVEDMKSTVNGYKNLIPARDVELDLDRVFETRKHPLVQSPNCVLWKKRKFLPPFQMSFFNSLDEVAQVLDSYEGNMNELLGKRDAVRRDRYFSVELTDMSQRSWINGAEAFTQEQNGQIRYFDPVKIEERVAELELNYTSTRTLGNEWRQKFRDVTKQGMEPYLKDHNLFVPTGDEIRSTGHIFREDAQINNSFVQDVNTTYESLQDALHETAICVESGGKEFFNGDQDTRYHLEISGTRFVDKGLFRQNFPGTQWNARSRRWVAGASYGICQGALLADKINDYNGNYGKNLKLHIKKVQ